MRVRSVVLGTFATLLLPESAAGQEIVRRDNPRGGADSVRVVASREYQVGGLRRFLLGGGYRELWATPIRAPVLDLGRFAGGLRPAKRGGGFQTRTLELVARDGREFRFRSVDKNPAQGLRPELRHSVVQDLVQDQTSAAHPAAAVVAAELAQAAGIPHTRPRLVVMPDDPRLGKFRSEFAGMLGTLEVKPEEGSKGAPGFLGFHEVVETEDLVQRLNASAADRVDPHAFLIARLFDMLLNDWDRHQKQWRWGTRDRVAPRRWRPIPTDRDQAFARYDGLLVELARIPAPRFVPFTHEYRLEGLTANSEELDCRLLVSLERSEWDSIAGDLQARLSDSVIARALARMPAQYRILSSGSIAAKLRSRREKLPEVAGEYYERLARFVDVHGTDGAEIAMVRHRPDRVVEIVLLPRTSPSSEPLFRRRFHPEETREVRIYLHGGDDSLAIHGTYRSPIVVRVVGGDGNDALGGEPERKLVRTYDSLGHRYSYAPDSVVEAALDRRPWRRTSRGELAPPPVDHGERLVPSLGAYGDPGFGTGFEVELALVRHGFLRVPHERRLSLALGYSFGARAFGVAAGADFSRENSPAFLWLSAMASELERPWFYGFGNETARGDSKDAHRARHTQYSVSAEVGVRGEHWLLSAGPVLQYSTAVSEPPPVTGGTVRGWDGYGQLGMRARARLDSRDFGAHPTRGFRLTGLVELYPAVWDVAGTFGAAEVSAATYLSAPLPLQPVLALRVGGRRVWGPFPWFEAAFLGGESNLRGYDRDRFAGEASAFGGAELRLKIGRMPRPLPGEFGLLTLVDAGRVWREGEHSGRWHASWGAGLWITLVNPATTASLTIARGAERTGVYVGGGFGF